jgi:hypothetical protein
MLNIIFTFFAFLKYVFCRLIIWSHLIERSYTSLSRRNTSDLNAHSRVPVKHSTRNLTTHLDFQQHDHFMVRNDGNLAMYAVLCYLGLANLNVRWYRCRPHRTLGPWVTFQAAQSPFPTSASYNMAYEQGPSWWLKQECNQHIMAQPSCRAFVCLFPEPRYVHVPTHRAPVAWLDLSCVSCSQILSLFTNKCTYEFFKINYKVE